MTRIRLELDQETYDRLLKAAVGERRPVVWQAEMMLRRTLGTTFPAEVTPPDGLTKTQTSHRHEEPVSVAG